MDLLGERGGPLAVARRQETARELDQRRRGQHVEVLGDLAGQAPACRSAFGERRVHRLDRQVPGEVVDGTPFDPLPEPRQLTTTMQQKQVTDVSGQFTIR